MSPSLIAWFAVQKTILSVTSPFKRAKATVNQAQSICFASRPMVSSPFKEDQVTGDVKTPLTAATANPVRPML